jgi:tetratricopeptide (TPR) repeat protein
VKTKNTESIIGVIKNISLDIIGILIAFILIRIIFPVLEKAFGLKGFVIFLASFSFFYLLAAFIRLILKATRLIIKTIRREKVTSMDYFNIWDLGIYSGYDYFQKILFFFLSMLVLSILFGGAVMLLQEILNLEWGSLYSILKGIFFLLSSIILLFLGCRFIFVPIIILDPETLELETEAINISPILVKNNLFIKILIPLIIINLISIIIPRIPSLKIDDPSSIILLFDILVLTIYYGLKYYDLEEVLMEADDIIDAFKKARFYCLRGMYHQESDLNFALENFNKAIKIAPHIELSYFYRGQVYLCLGDKEKALNDYNSLKEQNNEMATKLKEEIESKFC